MYGSGVDATAIILILFSKEHFTRTVGSNSARLSNSIYKILI